ncbi:hypothetical protein JVT61DRAFT_1841 [Boletus reticuloceps]|uniref:Uncharacterized protein n=1 Tax=Boletus reticuloceps TaxID=495285 RepID=A0A8I2YRL7_9AGAM|nr:hypothetical protein JVT61DRAFT_1841 [Boletus reticuloceps]
MPASTPSFGVAKVALVMAWLRVNGEDHGPRFFVVPVCNEREMVVLKGALSTTLWFVSRSNDLKDIIVSDGDVRTLCIRLFSELLLHRYQMPHPDVSESLLARHAVSSFEENRALLQELPGAFNTIEAKGHVMAYSTNSLRSRVVL